MLVLFADTDSDITPEIAKEYGYHIISMPYAIDGENTFPYEDYDVFEAKEYYDKLRGGVIPTTSALSAQRYLDYFRPVLAAGDDILYVHFSRNMSATFDNMDKAIAQLKEEYPERSVYTIDTKGISILTLSVIEEIGDMYKEGKSIEEILAWAEKEVDHFACYFFADDLKFFRRSGRVSGLAGTMGTLLGIRPIIYMNEEGKMVALGKEKGRVKAMERLVSYMEELGDDIKSHRVLVANCDAKDIADDIIAIMKERFGDDLDVQYTEVNPTIGAHCGPNAAGICFHAKRKTP
jgi:DegV family protein with EDD domain